MIPFPIALSHTTYGLEKQLNLLSESDPKLKTFSAILQLNNWNKEDI